MGDWQPNINSKVREAFPDCFAIKAGDITAACVPPDGKPGMYAWSHGGKVWLAEQSAGHAIGRVVWACRDYLDS